MIAFAYISLYIHLSNWLNMFLFVKNFKKFGYLFNCYLESIKCLHSYECGRQVYVELKMLVNNNLEGVMCLPNLLY